MIIKQNYKKKIPNESDLVKKAKLTELENKIPDASSSTTKTVVENKIPSVSSLVKKKQTITQKLNLIIIKNKLNNHNHDKYIATPEFNILAADVFNVTLAQDNLITKTYFDAKLSSLNRKIVASKSKHLLLESELNKLKDF